MSVRTGMFLACWVIFAMSGCAPHYVLRLTNPEQSTTVTLFEGGRDDTEEDDRTTVIDQSDRIAKVASFFQTKKDEFALMDTDFPRLPRCTVIFHRDLEETDRFWLDPTHLYMRTPDGKYFACKLTERESRKLVDIFRSTSNANPSE